MESKVEPQGGWKEGSLSKLQNELGLLMIQKEEVKASKEWEIYLLTGSEEIKTMLTRFAGVFEVPRSLPPHGRQNYSIPLEEGVKGLIIRPYRYSSTQKDVIERMVDEMLQMGIVQYSTSPFSSPVVLVKKKKNDSWRMCVDFIELKLENDQRQVSNTNYR